MVQIPPLSDNPSIQKRQRLLGGLALAKSGKGGDFHRILLKRAINPPTVHSKEDFMTRTSCSGAIALGRMSEKIEAHSTPRTMEEAILLWERSRDRNQAIRSRFQSKLPGGILLRSEPAKSSWDRT